MDDTPEDDNSSSVHPLERQVERGSLFTHTSLGESFNRLGEIQVLLHSVLDLLLGKGVVTEAEMTETMDEVRQELNERGELSGPGTMVRIDPADPPLDVKVDCDSRMHICAAVCCKLDFALSVSEIEAGNVKWDLGKPYSIRHEESGYCSHFEDHGSCAIHADRPVVCRTYSCAGDKRIWKDFDAMELNVEWIDANLSRSESERPRLILMDAQEVHVDASEDSAEP